MSQIAYLIESPYITNAGKLQAKSLRAFEVEYTIDTPNGFWHRAKLQGKYLGARTPTFDVTTITRRNACLFTSPDLALLAKSVAIKSRVQSRINELEANLADVKSALSYASIADEFVSRYPEHLV